MRRAHIFAILIAIFGLGGGLYLSTFPSWIGLVIMSISGIGLGLYLDLDRIAKENRKIIKLALSEFHAEGQTLMFKCDDVSIPPPNDDANSWMQKVEVFLREKFDESYVTRFRDRTNIMPAFRRSREDPSIPHWNLWGVLRIRVIRLHEFIKELD
jgi:hypothetical protein